MSVRELTLRATMPLVINSFNQLHYLRGMVEQFAAAGFRNLVIVDNGSSYPPLLDYLRELAEQRRAIVIYYGANHGPHHFFLRQLYQPLFESTPFLYSDPDIRVPDLAEDFLSRLFDLSRKYQCFKVGCALRIPEGADAKDDLLFRSEVQGTHRVADWERQFWRKPIEDNVYDAPIDTTLHLFVPRLYPPDSPLITGLRVAGPGFEALHLPWFRADGCPAAEQAFYARTAAWSNWAKDDRPAE